jgi:hypothetical protein
MEDIRNVCANIRKPGGQIVNPKAALPGQPPNINNPGIAVGHITEKRLKMLAYYINHLTRIQRRWAGVTTTLIRLAAVYQLKDQDNNDDDVALPPRLTNVSNVRECLEDVDDYFNRKRAESRCPLSYVTRMTVALPLPADDPGFRLPTYDAEMIARAPHTGPVFQLDNHAVWDVIRYVTHGGPGLGLGTILCP